MEETSQPVSSFIGRMRDTRDAADAEIRLEREDGNRMDGLHSLRKGRPSFVRHIAR